MKWMHRIAGWLERRPLTGAAVVGILLLLLLYGPLVLHPDQWIFASSGDGLKNYYTYAYHIRHDASYTNHMGMNYPYGENYMYIDGHPLPANSIKALSHILPMLPEYCIALLHLALLMSIPLAVVCFTAVLRHYGVRPWLAILFAVGTIALSPQIFRIDGHFALSYSMALPMTWWLYLRYQSHPQLSRAVALAINGTIWLFVHAYLGMIVLAWMVLLWLFDWRQVLRQSLSKAWHSAALVACVLPIVLFYVHVNATDPHLGRTDNPSGFFQYNAELDDVLVAPKGWFHAVVQSIPGVLLRLQWEACGYLGFFNILALIAIISRVIWLRTRSPLERPPHSLVSATLAAMVLLLFAMGLPFKMVPEWLDVFSIFKQFRATGRFVWPLYYVMGAVVAFALEQLWRSASEHPKWHRWALGGTMCYAIMQCIEAYSYHIPMRQKMMQTENLFHLEQCSTDLQNVFDHLNTKEFQAIVSLPFFYQGSESFSRPLNDEAVRNTMLLSYHSGLPTVCANLTRTSIPESKRIIQLISAPYYNKPIRHDFPNEKPFLILHTHQPLSANEKALLRRAECIYRSESFDLYRLNFHATFESQAQTLIDQFNNERSSLHRHDQFLTTASDDMCYIQNFEGLSQPIRHKGTGAFGGFKKGENIIAEWKPNAVDTSANYHMSMWMHNGEQDALNLWFPVYVEAIDANGKAVQMLRILPDQAETIDGDWSLVEGEFQWKNSNTTLRIRTEGHPLSKARLYVDDLLIRPSHVDVWGDLQDGGVYYNNHWIKRP